MHRNKYTYKSFSHGETDKHEWLQSSFAARNTILVFGNFRENKGKCSEYHYTKRILGLCQNFKDII